MLIAAILTPLVAEIETATMVVLAALVVTIGVLLVRTQHNLARSGRHDPYPSEKPSSVPHSAAAHHLGAPETMVRWEVQMQEIARDVSAQLDTKMRALQALMAEADRAAARLEAATAQARVSAPSRTDAEQAAAPPTVQPVSQAEALRSSMGAPRSTADAGVSRRVPTQQRREEIHLLADYGYPATEIAQRLAIPIGEVELVLALRQKQ